MMTLCVLTLKKDQTIVIRLEKPFSFPFKKIVLRKKKTISIEFPFNFLFNSFLSYQGWQILYKSIIDGVNICTFQIQQMIKNEKNMWT